MTSTKQLVLNYVRSNTTSYKFGVRAKDVAHQCQQLAGSRGAASVLASLKRDGLVQYDDKTKLWSSNGS